MRKEQIPCNRNERISRAYIYIYAESYVAFSRIKP